jgi:hypothetical protein
VSEWREHIAGPFLRNAQLCGRCGEVLWVFPGRTGRALPDRWQSGARVASNGEYSMTLTGWGYEHCKSYEPRMGDRMSSSLDTSQDTR